MIAMQMRNENAVQLTDMCFELSHLQLCAFATINHKEFLI
jgi:hypothetical protein